MNIAIEKIKKQIKKNKIILYMKGSPRFPECSFSAKTVNIILLFNIKFAYVDVLLHNDIRLNLPIYSQWPTFPQLWIKGKLIGGFDIINKMYNNGEFKKIIKNINI